MTDIRFPANNIATDGFRVEWTAPSGYERYISGYTVSGFGFSEDTGNATFAVITGRTPGQKYTVTVTSKNEVTQSNSVRSTAVSKEQSTSKSDKDNNFSSCKYLFFFL